MPFDLPILFDAPAPNHQLCSLSPQAAYDSGLELLGQQEAALALPRLEEALQGSLAHVESCRAGCEGPEEQQPAEEEEEEGSQGGLYEAIAGEGLDCVLSGSTDARGGTRSISSVCLLCRTLDPGSAVPAALRGRYSHPPWSQLPCPRLHSQPAETAAGGLCSGSDWGEQILGVKMHLCCLSEPRLSLLLPT